MHFKPLPQIQYKILKCMKHQVPKGKPFIPFNKGSCTYSNGYGTNSSAACINLIHQFQTSEQRRSHMFQYSSKKLHGTSDVLNDGFYYG